MSFFKLSFTLLSLCFYSLCFGEEGKRRAGISYVDQETLTEMDRKRAEPKITQEYSRGRFLIYDCSLRNFACVNEPSFKLCKAKRERGYRAKKFVLPCAPLKEFPKQESCFEKQYNLIHRLSEKSYCQNVKNAKY